MELSKEVQRKLDDAWLGIDIPNEELRNPLDDLPLNSDDLHLYVTSLLRQPEYFPLLCKEIFNIELYPTQAAVLKNLWNYRFPMLIASRGFSKSFSLAIHAILRALLIPGRKVVIAGSVFRQSKQVFEYAEGIVNKAPILKNLMRLYHQKPITKGTDMWTMRIGDSQIMAIPVGMGDSVRGLRANDLLVEEFAAHNRDVFETVLAGFIAVSSDPVEKLKISARQKMAEQLGIELDEPENNIFPDNQMVLCGTAYYQFNHFYEYWKKWKDIIETNDINKIKTTDDEEISDDLKPEHFSIIRIPFELVPRGFLDETQIARAKASMHSGNYMCEFGGCFSADSSGFFKRSLIESCVCNKKNEIVVDGHPLVFYPKLTGEKGARYVIGIDPASESDNFAVVVVEIGENHRKIVYCWTINRKEQKQRIKSGILEDTDFFYYCALKVRELMKTFDVERIGIDTQGGGYALIEALTRHDKTAGEQPIYPVIDPKNFRETDVLPGLHIVEEIQFADSKWASQANNGMRLDFEHKKLLFPAFDSLSLGFAELADQNDVRKYDTVEDCVIEIEAMKDELSSIIMEQTAAGRDRWVTPDTQISGTIKRKMRKDRYSALLIANAVARDLEPTGMQTRSVTIGGFASKFKEPEEGGPDFTGPEYITNKLQNLYG